MAGQGAEPRAQPVSPQASCAVGAAGSLGVTRANMRLKLSGRALYIEAHPLRSAARAARSLSATR
jgi:hypothetical protein